MKILYCTPFFNGLQNWRRMFGPEFSEFVFASPRNRNVHLTDYKSAWRNAAQTAGLRDRRIYDLRSTFATHSAYALPLELSLIDLSQHFIGH